MTNIIDINQRLKEASQPNAKFIHMDETGTPWYEYTCSYQIDGIFFCFKICAIDFDDAMRRLNAIRDTGKVDGHIYDEIDYE